MKKIVSLLIGFLFLTILTVSVLFSGEMIVVTSSITLMNSLLEEVDIAQKGQRFLVISKSEVKFSTTIVIIEEKVNGKPKSKKTKQQEQTKKVYYRNYLVETSLGPRYVKIQTDREGNPEDPRIEIINKIVTITGDVRFKQQNTNNTTDFSNDLEDKDIYSKLKFRIAADAKLGNDIDLNVVCHKDNRYWGQEGEISASGYGYENLNEVGSGIEVNQVFLHFKKGAAEAKLGRQAISLDHITPLYSYKPFFELEEIRNPLLFYIGDSIFFRLKWLNVFYSVLEEKGRFTGNNDVIMEGFWVDFKRFKLFAFVRLEEKSYIPLIGCTTIFSFEKILQTLVQDINKYMKNPNFYFLIATNYLGKDKFENNTRGVGLLINFKSELDISPVKATADVLYGEGSGDNTETDSNENFYTFNYSPEGKIAEIFSNDIFRYTTFGGIGVLKFGVEKLKIEKFPKTGLLSFYFFNFTHSSTKKNLGYEIDIHFYPYFIPNLFGLNHEQLHPRFTMAWFFPGDVFPAFTRDTVSKLFFELIYKFSL